MDTHLRPRRLGDLRESVERQGCAVARTTTARSINGAQPAVFPGREDVTPSLQLPDRSRVFCLSSLSPGGDKLHEDGPGVPRARAVSRFGGA